MNHSASQLRFTLSRCHAPTSDIDRGEIACLRARSAINYPSMVSILATPEFETHASLRRCVLFQGRFLIGVSRSLIAAVHSRLSSVEPHRLTLGDLDRGLGVLASGTDVGEHVEDDEVGKRRGRLLADRAKPARGERALGGFAENRVL